MISRRLTKIQKDEIVEAYRTGETANTLAFKYSCSSNTINRTVKTLLSEAEYKSLKEKIRKASNKKLQKVDNKSFDSKEEVFDEPNSIDFQQAKVNKEKQTKKTDNDSYSNRFEEIAFLPVAELAPLAQQSEENYDIDQINKDSDNKFEEIAPLLSSFDCEKNELDFEILNQESLPESVYMLVDKKVELEVKTISDLPEWSFLPENELKRNAILLFYNQRTAKRSCSKNQRVIKIPNTNVFQVSKSYLVLKGITRLILEESIIALDN